MKKTVIFLMIFTTALPLPSQMAQPSRLQILNQIEKIKITEYKSLPFSEERLKEYLELRVEHPKIVFKQAVLESGRFSSASFVYGNNLFGMKKPIVRKTKAIGTYLRHAKYKHWTDSVDDYALWQQYYKSKGYKLNNYYKFLGRIYAEDKNYIKKLKCI